MDEREILSCSHRGLIPRLDTWVARPRGSVIAGDTGGHVAHFEPLSAFDASFLGLEQVVAAARTSKRSNQAQGIALLEQLGDWSLLGLPDAAHANGPTRPT